MNSFEDIAKKEYEKSNNDIFPFIFEEKQYWLKKARATKPDKIQKFFYKFFPFELLIPPIVKSSKEALLYEISKLEKFKELGINVPKVVLKNSDYFILEDSGKSVNRILKNKNIIEKDFYFYIDLALFELAKIHNCNSFHGGSQLRNFTFKDGKVFVLDFEESFQDNVDIKKLQYRDFLLFLLSFLKLKKLNFKIDYERIINKYLELSSNFEFKNKLIIFSKRLRFFSWLYEKDFIKKRVGSDVKYFFELIEILNKMGKNAK
ncbi:kinase [Aliarcobacter cryaerophilus]|uniref:Kinase n=1 Tax=Aliarcobacter cryaerophilus TaxID=28198 RepID=A0A2S9T5A0_9BACT|nr:kinase [Aliarcobacter cryaerophilus]PRM94002.1 kinase [Aliarcobacter cryaerophilus]